MAIGKGGSSGSQGGTTDTQTAGNTSSANIAMPIAPGGYEDAWRSMLGTGGNTPGQTAAMNFYTQPGGNNLLNPSGNGWYGAVDRNNQIAAATDPSKWTNPTPVVAGQVGATPAASYMGAYTNPYQQQVVDATTASANRQLGNTLNDITAQYGGQYGNGRSGVAIGQAIGDTNTGLNNTIAGLNASGFNTALGAGQNDAANALSASNANASNQLNANEFSQQLAQQNKQFDLSSLLSGIQNQMGNTATAAGIGTNAANSAAGIGGNVFNQGITALGAGTPLFGQVNAGANDAAGNSTGQTTGKSSSKGGGLST